MHSCISIAQAGNEPMIGNTRMNRDRNRSFKLPTLLRAGALAALILGSGAASAGKKNDTLVWLYEAEAPTYDFYAQQQRIGVIVARHVWDTLVDQDPISGEVKPHLATSYTFPNPTTIEFKLRQGVKFHNGDPFTAD